MNRKKGGLNDGMSAELVHHGILGQKWGVRRYQNPDGSLTEAGRRRLEKADISWAKKNENRLRKAATSVTKKDIKEYAKKELDPKYGKAKYNKDRTLNKYYVNEYNRKLSELMNQSIGDIPSPSGRVVRFVAKRGEMGVHLALADSGYDMNQIKNGVFNNGKIAYRKENVKVESV